jgi:glycerol-3-phosphate O-acyltransferase
MADSGFAPFPPNAARAARNARLGNAGYGPIARRLLGWLFGPVEFPEEAVAPLRELSQRATLVYVLRASALLQLLYFNFRLYGLGLPIARAATGLGYRILSPFARWYLGGAQVKPPSETTLDRPTAAVVEAVRQGKAALVFLRLPRTLPSAVAQLADPFPALIALQRSLLAGTAQPPRPIALVPLTLLWRRRPRQLSRSLRDVLFGDPEEPGALRAFIGFLLHRRTAFVKVGTPVELSGELAALPAPIAADDFKVARRVRGFLHQHLARETRVVTGPPLKARGRVADETLRDLTLRRVLDGIARERGRADDSVYLEARKDLHEIAARYKPFAVDVLARILHFVFHRIYDGIDVDEEGMRRLIEMGAKGPLILCPSHKSHIDYMVLSLVCDERGMQPPHVAAGDNLDFWPVGRLLRMGGAFFIRRSFKGDRVYAATLSAYVKRLLRDGFTQEFFVEGGRSRTGKLLPPKFGMLAMEVEAWLTGVRSDVFFAPVSISYEKIAEGASYQRELLGGEKRKEDAKALLSATRVLKARYGRLTIRFAEPISLAAHFAERGIDPKSHDPEARRKLVAALGWRVAAGINRAAPLAPMGLACAALLSHDLRALSEDEVFVRAEFLREAALDAGAHAPAWSPSAGAEARLPPPPLRRSGLLTRALESLRADGVVRQLTAGQERFYSVVEERRMALDYHKNAILHFLVGPAILASALRSFAGQPAPLPALLLRAKELSRLFKHEFIYEPGRPFEAIVDETFHLLLRWGLAEKRGPAPVEEVLPAVAGVRKLVLLADLLRPFAEGVWLAATSLTLLSRGPMDAKEWSRAALERGRAAYLAGRIRRAESLSKATLDNALLMLMDRGIAVQGEGKSAVLSLAPAWQAPEKLAQLAAEIDLYLR